MCDFRVYKFIHSFFILHKGCEFNKLSLLIIRFSFFTLYVIITIVFDKIYIDNRNREK